MKVCLEVAKIHKILIRNCDVQEEFLELTLELNKFLISSLNSMMSSFIDIELMPMSMRSSFNFMQNKHCMIT